MHIRPLGVLLTLTCALTFASPAGAQAAAPKPNIVVILADDMGFSDVSPYGGEINTPNLARLADGGLRFTQFYNTGRCCPTRAALLTGLYPHQAGVGHMVSPIGDFPGYRGNLSAQARTVAEVLKPAGYSTYMTGKWHLTNQSLPNKSKATWPLQRGFDRYYGTVKGGGSFYDPAMLTRDNTPINPYADPEYKPKSSQYYYTDAIADHSARFIREHHDNVGDRPFFLYVAFTAPHWPLHAPAEAVAKYKGKYDAGYEPVRAARFERQKAMGVVDAKAELPPAPVEWADVQNKAWEARCMEVYAAQVELMDAGIGRIIDALRETGQLDDTLILFLSDNGGSPEQQGRKTQPERANAKPIAPRPADQVQLEIAVRHTVDGRPVRNGPDVMPGPDDTFIAYGEGWSNVSNTPFREHKSWVHEGGVSTPLIAHWPAGISRKGDWERQPGHLIDLMATFVELAGATYPGEHDGKPVPPMQGVSLAPTFRGEQLNRERPIFFEHQGNRAIRDGGWKLVAKKDAPWELYNIAADRAELHDLAAKEPERLKAMSDAWQSWAEASQVLPLNPGRVARARQQQQQQQQQQQRRQRDSGN
jgi:arylsulfatase